MNARPIIVLILIQALGFSQTRNPWKNFVPSPTKENFLRCEGQIRQSLPDVSGNDSTITLIQVSEIQNKLLGIVAKGNPYAMELCFELYRIFPPGYAASREYFNGALGMSATRNPKVFLKLLYKYEKLDPYYDNTKYVDIDTRPLTVGVTPNLLDNAAGQEREFAKRLKSIESVNGTTCSTIQDTCVKILKEEIKRLSE